MRDSKRFRNRDLSRTATTALLCAVALLVLFPLYLSLVVALKTPREMGAATLFWPKAPRFQNFLDAIKMTDYFRALTNSTFLTIIAAVLTMATNSFTAYAIARNWGKRFYRFLYFYFLSAMFIPFPIIMLPIVKQTAAIGLDNMPGLVLLYVLYGLPMNVFLYVGYLRTMPKDLEEAARIDGAGDRLVFTRIVFPLLAPINATALIMTCLWVWNDFMLPLVIISDAAQYTLPLVQYVFQTQFSTNYNLAFASYFLVMLPLLVAYVFIQRRLIDGVMSGAIKG